MKGLTIKTRRGKIISLKEFRAKNREKLLTYAMPQKQLISGGLLTSYKIKKMVQQKKLNKITSGGKIYFKSVELASCIVRSTTQQRLF